MQTAAPDVRDEVADRPGAGPGTGLWLPTPTQVLLAAGAFLAFLLAVVAVFDGLDAAARFGNVDGTYPIWYQLFQEGSMAEWGQSALLLLALGCAGIAMERSRSRGDRDVTALLVLLAASAALLSLEDAGNVGQRIAQWAGEAFGEASPVAEHGRLPVLVVVAVLPVYALLRHHAVWRTHPVPFALVAGSIATYGLVGLTGEMLGNLVPFYEEAGRFVLQDLAGGRLDPGAPLWDEDGLVFMDYVYEESLELVATALFAAGLVAFARDLEPRRLPVTA